MRVLRPSLAQHRADFSRRAFSPTSSHDRTPDDTSSDRTRAGSLRSACYPDFLGQGQEVSMDDSHATDRGDASPTSNHTAIKPDSGHIRGDILRYERDARMADAESDRFRAILSKLRSSDDAANTAAVSDLLKIVSDKNAKLKAELDHVRATDSLVVDACAELKREIQHMWVLRDIEKLRAIHRFDHPCGEIFLLSRKPKRQVSFCM